MLETHECQYEFKITLNICIKKDDTKISFKEGLFTPNLSPCFNVKESLVVQTLEGNYNLPPSLIFFCGKKKILDLLTLNILLLERKEK